MQILLQARSNETRLVLHLPGPRYFVLRAKYALLLW